MKVQVKHKGVDITSHVISYQREHKICTGIGNITLDVENNIGRSFAPWDSIDIYENGDYKIRYYISKVDNEDPKATITIEGQDKSKRLVDYFIPDQYTVEEPTYTRYWIEKFLDEAGVSYSFTTSSPGQLISNYTSLGLTQAYDQIMLLLQMSGWYMYFDGNGNAIIGDLTKELTPVDAKLTKRDILEISVIKDDKMLRNRALVWGDVDPYRMERVFADVRVRTKWNYDAADLRTMVVSNSNIPNNSTAYGMANQLLKEFSRITIEKHLAVHGARNLYVGDTVKVTSTVYTGLGLITTFGVSMSKQGLITNLILDERCPRLFGFFDFGDYVYVGTYGDGVWRKHIRFDHTWHDFSDGLDDMAVTDLHINNGIFSSVTSSGGMFYTLADDEPWTKAPVIALDSVVGSGGDPVTYSGIMGRATIVDKEFNRIIYGVDTYSGLNYGDYYMSYSGYFNSMSGILLMSGIEDNLRGWVVEFNLASGMDTFNSYPVSVSGNYKIFVLDIENDGHNDYVSVGLIGSGVDEQPGNLYNMGQHANEPLFQTHDTRAVVLFPASVDYANEADYTSFNAETVNENAILCIDNQVTGNTVLVTVGFDGKVKEHKLEHYMAPGGTHYSIFYTATTSSAQTFGNSILSVRELGVGKYEIYYYGWDGGSPVEIDFYRRVWRAYDNTWEDEELLSTFTYTPDSIDTNAYLSFDTITVNDIVYFLAVITDQQSDALGFPADSLGYATVQGKLSVNLIQINQVTGGVSSDLMLELLAPEGTPGSGKWMYFYNHSVPYLRLFQDGTGIKILGWRDMMYREMEFTGLESNRIIEYVFHGNSTVLGAGQIFDETNLNDASVGTYRFNGSTYKKQLTSSRGVIVCSPNVTPSKDGFVLTTDLLFDTFSAIPDSLIGTIPNFSSNGLEYTAYDGAGTWSRYDSSDMGFLYTIVPPPNLTPNKLFSTRTTGFGGYSIWEMTDTDESVEKLVPELGGTFYPHLAITNYALSAINDQENSIMVGGWLLQSPVEFGGNVAAVYIDFGALQADSVRFLVLQRENTDFNIVQEAAYPIRIDISNFAPLETVQNVEATFKSYFIVDNSVEEFAMYPTLSGMTQQVEDYRYTLIPGSGMLGISRQTLYVEGTAITAFESETMSGVHVLYDLSTTISGGLGRIETSNYAASGQYIFVTTSGEFPQFYQKDCDTDLFVLYSGLPDSRATIIRLDDRV